MKIIRHIVIVLALLVLSFSLIFFLSNNTEYHTVDNYVEEPRIYVTKYGNCYHAPDCQYLSHSKIEMGLYYAKSNGYRACHYCKGLPCGTVKVNYYKTEKKSITDEVAVKSILFASLTATIYISFCVTSYMFNKKPNKS